MTDVFWRCTTPLTHDSRYYFMINPRFPINTGLLPALFSILFTHLHLWYKNVRTALTRGYFIYGAASPLVVLSTSLFSSSVFGAHMQMFNDYNRHPLSPYFHLLVQIVHVIKLLFQFRIIITATLYHIVTNLHFITATLYHIQPNL
jgi:hypothetical protein